ncbi:MAG: hypothetical protein ACRDZO_14050 [Egibacteraceae bacterium]
MRQEAGAVFLKSIADLLAKTNFATLFSRLPAQDHGYYSVADNFADLVASARGYNALMRRPLFDDPRGPLYGFQLWDEAQAGEAEWYKDLIFKDWIDAMASGRDLLTKAEFPNLPAGKKVEGFGVHGERMDVNPTSGLDMPIFELRSFNKNMNLTDFKDPALKLFAYVRALSEGRRQRIT